MPLRSVLVVEVRAQSWKDIPLWGLAGWRVPSIRRRGHIAQPERTKDPSGAGCPRDWHPSRELAGSRFEHPDAARRAYDERQPRQAQQVYLRRDFLKLSEI